MNVCSLEKKKKCKHFSFIKKKLINFAKLIYP